MIGHGATIPDKATFKRLSASGRLGNHFRTWHSWDELCGSYSGFVTVRSDSPDSPLFIPSVHVTAVPSHAKFGGFYFQEVPHAAGCDGSGCDGCGRLMNFEAGLTSSGVHVKHSHHPSMNLRRDLEENGKECSGLAAVVLLQDYLREGYRDTLCEVWNSYPNAVIEGSVFSRAVGVLNQPLVIWEVRNY